MYNSTVRVYVIELLNGCTDLNEICCACLSGSLNGLDSQLDPLSPTRGGPQTGILSFTMEIVVYKWLLLVKGEISILFIFIMVAIG